MTRQDRRWSQRFAQIVSQRGEPDSGIRRQGCRETYAHQRMNTRIDLRVPSWGLGHAEERIDFREHDGQGAALAQRFEINIRPVFCDINEQTFNLDPKSVEANITPYTKAIMAVDIFGHSANMDALMGHFQTEHMDEFLRELPQVVSGEITTRRYAVQSVDEETEDSSDPPPIVH